MQLDSVRELKAALHSSILAPLTEPPRLRALGVPAGAMAAAPVSPRTLALGIVPGGGAQYRLAVRLQRRALEGSDTVEAIKKHAKGEVEVRYIGRVVKRGDGASFQQRLRPLQIGGSVGHFKITAGTLGAFVRARAGGGGPLILSNNHVLANENKAKKGDAILQPGQFDNGAVPDDRIGSLADFKRLKRTGANLLDCASATLADGLAFDSTGLQTVGKLKGVRSDISRTGEIVHKVGRTTGITRGRVTAIEVDNLVIDYGIGSIRFDQQIEIEGADDEGFSSGGDSGSLIVDDAGLALALLFAGGDTGGSNGKGLTYANPIQPVLDALKVDLLL
jgi:hypothetical protein